MVNKLNRRPAPKELPRIDPWTQKFNELCYQVFQCSGPGKELLNHMENKFFRSPVANPNMDPQHAFFNEGRNDHIRSYSHAIAQHLRPEPKPKPPQGKMNARRI